MFSTLIERSPACHTLAGCKSSSTTRMTGCSSIACAMLSRLCFDITMYCWERWVVLLKNLVPLLLQPYPVSSVDSNRSTLAGKRLAARTPPDLEIEPRALSTDLKPAMHSRSAPSPAPSLRHTLSTSQGSLNATPCWRCLVASSGVATIRSSVRDGRMPWLRFAGQSGGVQSIQGSKTASSAYVWVDAKRRCCRLDDKTSLEFQHRFFNRYSCRRFFQRLAKRRRY